MKCLSPKCENESRTRGLCAYCYKDVMHLIKVGVLKHDDMLAAGLLGPKGKRGKKKTVLSDSDLYAILMQAGTISSRDEYIKAIGGSLDVLSKKHREFLDQIFPETKDAA